MWSLSVCVCVCEVYLVLNDRHPPNQITPRKNNICDFIYIFSSSSFKDYVVQNVYP